MKDTWKRIEDWLRTNAPAILVTLQPGATDSQIQELEEYLSVKFPIDVKESYLIHNGQNGYDFGLVDGQEFLSLERIKDEWEVWKGLLDGGDFEGSGSEPDTGIKPDWWNEKWIPLTYDGWGNHYCLDLDPAEGGSVGQIITMWHDDVPRELLAGSFREWLKRFADKLEAGEYLFSEEYRGIVKKKVE